MLRYLSLAACCGVLVLATGCSGGGTNFTQTFGRSGTAFGYAGALAMAVPPANTVIFGPCKEEFGMPDSRRNSCELYYRVRGEASPWDQRQTYYQETNYQPGQLTCWRTLGKITECGTVSGTPNRPPAIVVPNNLGSE